MSSSRTPCRKSKGEDLRRCPRYLSDQRLMENGYQAKLKYIRTVCDTIRQPARKRSVSKRRYTMHHFGRAYFLLDVLFSNIKHLFFQPCDKELLVILHIHLKAPIMIGKKKAHVCALITAMGSD